ncbi:protein phosphatase 1 regulatory subunit 12A-like isoform X2 [Eleutherodactylus coqui]|uniref:protein phosphatase 1 regulatory subunit 12A-like isoform X2 n=1 Tax=Eleutherodactylus coqui TaxID=57060 RepID=UPI003461B94C
MAAEDGSRSESAKEKRMQQVKTWDEFERKQCLPPRSSRSQTRVSFAQGAVFMAACSAGDREEVRQLLADGAPINGTNVDGLTALHQACIDENIDMVEFLVENGASVNQQDNEGWTPLHAAASCGFVAIAQYLLSKGANVAIINSEGELPLDVSHESAMEKLLKSEVKKLGVDLDVARKEEEELMLRDARRWLNNGKYDDIRHPTTGATALHVAAAKGYTEVIRLLLQLGFDVDSRDLDGWTPLHAAAHWGQQDACRLLCEALCDMEAVNKVGQTSFDVADDSLESVLEELKTKQSALRLEKMKNAPQIMSQANPPNQNAAGRPRSQEKVALRVQDKERRTQPISSTVPTSQPIASSSEESGSDAESEKVKAQERINNLNNRLRNHATPATKKTSAVPEQEKTEPSSGSWRASLRKTGSSGTLSSGTTLEEGRKAALPKSASSSQLADREKTGPEPRLARVPPSQKLFSNQENVREPFSRLSLNRNAGDEGLNSLRRQREPLTETSLSRREALTARTETTGTSGDTLSSRVDATVPTPNSLTRIAGTANPRSTNLEQAPNTETRERRRSYLTPVRDEEAEAQRKAKSRHARQSRRSTQGVTLTDLQEAEKVIKGQQDSKEAEPEPAKTQEEEASKDNQTKPRSNRATSDDGAEVSWRSRFASLQKSDLLGLTTPDPTPTSSGSQRKAGQNLESKEMQKSQEDEKESDERGSRSKAAVRDRRRPREKRKSTGVPQITRNSDGEEEDETEESPQAQVDGLNSRVDKVSNAHTASRVEAAIAAEHRDTKDFKKLYEDLMRDNGRLRSQLLNTQNLVNETKAELERANQRQERSIDRSFLIDTEKKEKLILERRVSELQDELKILGDLKADNQRLKDENGALIRVISKLSK